MYFSYPFLKNLTDFEIHCSYFFKVYFILFYEYDCFAFTYMYCVCLVSPQARRGQQIFGPGMIASY